MIIDEFWAVAFEYGDEDERLWVDNGSKPRMYTSPKSAVAQARNKFGRETKFRLVKFKAVE